jgi:Predicted transcriptional regulators
MSTPSQFSIRDLAREFEVTSRTLRFYEEKGLLKPRREGQTRWYSPADRTRLRLILRGKRLGLSLEESADIINLYDPATGNKRQIKALLNRIRDKRQELLERQRELNLILDDLKRGEERCLAALEWRALRQFTFKPL